jgi:hypothetical protein
MVQNLLPRSGLSKQETLDPRAVKFISGFRNAYALPASRCCVLITHFLRKSGRDPAALFARESVLRAGARFAVPEEVRASSILKGGVSDGLFSTFELYNRSHKPRLTHGCLFASGHHGPTVDTFERERCSLVSVLSVV